MDAASNFFQIHDESLLVRRNWCAMTICQPWSLASTAASRIAGIDEDATQHALQEAHFLGRKAASEACPARRENGRNLARRAHGLPVSARVARRAGLPRCARVYSRPRFSSRSIRRVTALASMPYSRARSAAGRPCPLASMNTMLRLRAGDAEFGHGVLRDHVPQGRAHPAEQIADAFAELVVADLGVGGSGRSLMDSRAIAIVD